MLMNKIQSPGDYSEFFKISRDYALAIYDNAPDDIRQVFTDILWSLFMKMNIPVKEAQDAITQLEVGGMGYLFENTEKMDIQAERKNTEEQRKRAEAAEQRASSSERITGLFIKNLIQSSKASGCTKEEVQKSFQFNYTMEESKAKDKIEKYWN